MAARFLSSFFRFRLLGTSRLRRVLFITVLFSLLTFGLYYSLLSNMEEGHGASRLLSALQEVGQKGAGQDDEASKADKEYRQKWMLQDAVGSFRQEAAKFDTKVKKEMHVFYYAWYGNTTFDSDWIHWNHPFLPSPSNDREENRSPMRYHEPPEDIGSTYYPLLGPYSSQDARLMKKHMEWMKLSGADVVVLSWYPNGLSDPNGKPVDQLVPVLLETADANGLKVAFHIEPFKRRDADSMHRAIAYLITRYGNHSAMYKYRKSPNANPVPLIYVYDSYLVPNADWNALLLPSGQGGDSFLSIRGTKYDAFIIGLCLLAGDLPRLKSNGFDGAYTYFAANGMTECSTRNNWDRLASRAAELGLLFIPSTGPGYDDTRVREWNKVTTRSRGQNGDTLASSLKTAIKAVMLQADANNKNAIVSLTSFNEWHEGTQIEPARPYSTSSGFDYPDYLPHDPFFYLKLTRELVENTWKHNGADQRKKAPLSARHGGISPAETFSNA